jgi:hypothetical protein
MKFLRLVLLFLPACPGFCQNSAPAAARNADVAANVNSRYVVEAVEVHPERLAPRIPAGLRDRMKSLAGSRFDPSAFEELADRLRSQFPRYRVAMKMAKGGESERVRVTFELERKNGDAEVVMPRFLYSSKQNFTFGLDGTWRGESYAVSAGVLTDNDELLERYSGVRAGVERNGLAGDRLRFGFAAETWRSQWNSAVESRIPGGEPGVYRTRVQFRPYLAMKLFEPLEWEAGVSLHRLQMQYPEARHELSSAAFTTLRLERRWKDSHGDGKHKLESSYQFRLGAGDLGSDFSYRRHYGDFTYRYERERDVLAASFFAGTLNGRAPLYERFVVGNSRALRGWSKYDLAPFGGGRVAHASVDYSHREFRVVYDTGSVWEGGGNAVVRHSIAFGYGRGFGFLVAFPLRDGAMYPIFLLGMNF